VTIAAKRLTLTGGGYRVSVRLPDRGQAATPTGSPVPTSRHRATGHNARERDAGERRDAGLMARRWSPIPVRACSMTREECRSQLAKVPVSKPVVAAEMQVGQVQDR